MAVARSIVLRQLAAAPRTRAELAAALRKRGVQDEAARQVLDRYVELGYVDDATLAAAWARARVGDRGLGSRAVAHGLRRRGVDDEHVAAALADLTPEDEEEAARRLVRKRLASSGNLRREVLQRRLLAMLARKGHSSGTALRVVREELDRAGVTRDRAAEEGHDAPDADDRFLCD